MDISTMKNKKTEAMMMSTALSKLIGKNTFLKESKNNATRTLIVNKIEKYLDLKNLFMVFSNFW